VTVPERVDLRVLGAMVALVFEPSKPEVEKLYQRPECAL
jgi:hypothetical protein